MAEPLIAQYGAEIPRRLAAELAAASPGLSAAAFERDALDGYAALGLMDRGRQLAAVMARHLPADFPLAVQQLLASLGPPRPAPGMAAFYWLPHGLFVAAQGGAHVDTAMAALEILTQRFSAEFAIRPLLDQHPQAARRWLRHWAQHPQAAVRRLVSEGTRPRLPWAPRLRRFSLELDLLAALRDDPSEDVRRSVANHLNDIGKQDMPRLLVIASDWAQGAPPNRERLLRHALRWALKRGDAGALALFGHQAAPRVAIEGFALNPPRPRIGDRLEISLSLRSLASEPQLLRADLCVDFLKASGRTQRKPFCLARFELQPGERKALRKTLSLAELTTRRPYPGPQGLALQLNGHCLPLPGFELREAAAPSTG